MKVILNCTNLIGDSVYLLNPVKAFLEQHPDECVAIVADKGFAFEMFFNTFNHTALACLLPSIPLIFDTQEDAVNCFPHAQVLYVGAGQSGEVCFQESRKPGGRQLHISEGYAKMLGVTLDTLRPTNVWQRVLDTERLDPFILIAPFSRSCSVHTTGVANKTIADWKWEHIIHHLRKQNLPVKVLAGPNDYLKKCSVSMNDYITCKSLYELELTLKSAKLFVTLDNGVGHIAAALDVPMIYLWPKVSCIEFIAPLYAKKTVYLMMEPNEAAPVAMMVGFRKFVRHMLETDHEEVETLQED